MYFIAAISQVVPRISISQVKMKLIVLFLVLLLISMSFTLPVSPDSDASNSNLNDIRVTMAHLVAAGWHSRSKRLIGLSPKPCPRWYYPSFSTGRCRRSWKIW